MTDLSKAFKQESWSHKVSGRNKGLSPTSAVFRNSDFFFFLLLEALDLGNVYVNLWTTCRLQCLPLFPTIGNGVVSWHKEAEQQDQVNDHRVKKICIDVGERHRLGRWLVICKEGCFTFLLSVSQEENIVIKNGCKMNVILNIRLSVRLSSPFLITPSGFWSAMWHLKEHQDFHWSYTVDRRSGVRMLLLPSHLCC